MYQNTSLFPPVRWRCSPNQTGRPHAEYPERTILCGNEMTGHVRNLVDESDSKDNTKE